MSHFASQSAVSYRVMARAHVAGFDLTVFANLRRWRGDAWKILNDGCLRVTDGEWTFSDDWVTEHWDAVADALIAAADAFLSEQRATQMGR